MRPRNILVNAICRLTHTSTVVVSHWGGITSKQVFVHFIHRAFMTRPDLVRLPELLVIPGIPEIILDSRISGEQR